jgi:peroxiredoxin
VGALFGAEQAVLDAAGIPDGVMSPATTLASARDGRPAVVIFHRGARCPFCNLTLRAYQDQLPLGLAERGITLIAISPQKPDGSLSIQEPNTLTYAVLSDPGNHLAKALVVLFIPSEETRRPAQARRGHDRGQR